VRVLVVEDNRRLAGALKGCLEDEGYAVDLAYDGRAALDYALVTPYDAIILDVMLPLADGVEVCRTLRGRRINVPIIMLTARDAVEDRVRGLDSGADDYLVKPFALEELRARIRALLRRQAEQKGEVIAVGDLSVSPASHEVRRAGRPIELTAREYALLEYLVRHPNQIITREMAEAHIWSYDYEGSSNVVDVYVRRLRRKIDDPFPEKLIATVRGAGYRLRAPAPAG
jgi:DNA-binding response OmpR family regulator